MAHRNGVSNFKFFVIFLLFWRQLDAGEVAQCQKADGQLEMDGSGIKIKFKRIASDYSINLLIFVVSKKY